MAATQNSTYHIRKQCLPEYSRLFAALLDIPEKDVRDRVTDAINGILKCSVCGNKIECRDFASQTESVSEPGSSLMEGTEYTEVNSPKHESSEKRRRKRKRNCPKVVKTAQHSNITPVLRQENDPKKQTYQGEMPAKVMRTISTTSDAEAVDVFMAISGHDIINNINSNFEMQNEKDLENIKQLMTNEWEISDRYNEFGLLPIHQSIVENNIHKLRRQIYVWNFRKKNLMELLTENEGDNPIQLSIKENCLHIIINELLQHNIELDDIDDDSNTILHLAVSHLKCDDIQQQKQLLKTLESILERVDLQMLLELNNDGLTALQIAVKNSNYLMVEKILSFIDQRLGIEGVTPLNNPNADKNTFLVHYCEQSKSFDGRLRENFKDQILNVKDMKGGCTALLFAMELGYEHLVYLLLAHMADPNVKNLSGLDAKTFYNEHQGKSAQIIATLDNLSLALLTFP